MQLNLQGEIFRDVVVIRCRGSIVTGEEVRSLQKEVEKLTLITKKVVLNLSQVTFIDSGGVGALIRLSRVLRSGGGDLVLCQLSPFVHQVLKVTTLLRVFQVYLSETEAIHSFSTRSAVPEAAAAEPHMRVLCVDTSADLLAFVSALLRPAGFEVFTSTSLADARTLVIGVRPSVLICGPGIRSDDPALERIRRLEPEMRFLHLPPDFSSAEATQTGSELVARIRSLPESGKSPS